jgi:hypothetical protein
MNQESKLLKSKLGLLNLAEPTEPKTLKISAESGKVPSPSLSAENLDRFEHNWARRNTNLSALLNFMSHSQPKKSKSFPLANPVSATFI